MSAARPVTDDTRHALLSKARPISQTSIESFLALDHQRRDRPQLPRSSFGTYRVREVEVKSALTSCAMPSNPWSLNPYTGCSHDCTYCYVPDVAHLDRQRWGRYVVVKRNLPKVLSHELKRKERRKVFISSATDPYQPAEGEHRITRRCLELLARADWPVRVLTRSPLVVRDLDLFEQFSDLTIGLSIPTLDDAARRAVEPGAPPIQGRLKALARLTEVGLDTYANLAPAYPLTGGLRADDVAQAFAETGVPVVYAGRWNYLDGILGPLRDRLDGTRYDVFADAVQRQDYYDRLFAALGGAFRRVGLDLVEM